MNNILEIFDNQNNIIYLGKLSDINTNYHKFKIVHDNKKIIINIEDGVIYKIDKKIKIKYLLQWMMDNKYDEIYINRDFAIDDKNKTIIDSWETFESKFLI